MACQSRTPAIKIKHRGVLSTLCDRDNRHLASPVTAICQAGSAAGTAFYIFGIADRSPQGSKLAVVLAWVQNNEDVMGAVGLSDAALALLLRHVEQSELPADDSNRELHRDLASARLMVAVHTFSGGREQFNRFTAEGLDFARALKSA